MKTQYALRVFLLVVAASALLVACGPRTVGHGVLLWPEDNPELAGAVVSILEISNIQNSYIIAFEDGTREMIPQWRIRFFNSATDAREFADAYAQVAQTFVRADRNALPVRRILDRTSQAVYRLREGEEAKVISRTAEPHNEAGLVAHWYEVLTEDGTTGWTFGFYLTAFEAGQQVAVRGADDEVDPLIERLVDNVWRPSSIGQMIRNGTIDLAQMRSDFGLFPEPEENRFRLVLPGGRSEVFRYTDIVRSTVRQYALQGTTLQVTFRSENAITIQYTVGTQTESADLEIIEHDLAEVREREIERRTELIRELAERSDRWVSSAYGRITLSSDGRFQWTGYESFVPTVIPRGAGLEGRIEFSHFLAPPLRGSFDGVLTFRFNQLDNRPVHFAYTRTDTGMRLTNVPPQNINRNVVMSVGSGSVVAFFTADPSS
ncbi:MAG: hypothetical protein EA403_08515 [Spirochaetaceae bacterium]|nr:MAG: hypothetical protein EA403_08515 [Spirochaetaceae bacterium]